MTGISDNQQNISGKGVMKKISLVLTLGLLLSLTCLSTVYADGSTAELGKIDFKLTADYVKGWENRDRFPENVPFGYYYAYSLKALGEEITPAARMKIVKFIRSCQMQRGGFTTESTSSKAGNIIFTYYALKTLALLDAVDSVDAGKAERFILGLAQADGGFKGSYKKGERTSLAMTFYGVESLRILGGLDRLNQKKVAQFVNGHKAIEKGYSLNPKGLSSTQGSLMAVQILTSLNNLSEASKTGVVDYLKSTRYAGLVETGEYATVPFLKGMTEVIQTLSLLSALDQGNRAKMQWFVESLYITENGGFGPRAGMGTTPNSTFNAVLSLVKLGVLKDPDAFLHNRRNAQKPGTE